jgi:uncharacterized protein with FMN-binding domain
MRKRATAGGIVASAAILAIGWHLGSDQVAASTTTVPTTGTASGSTATPSASAGAAPSSSASSSATAAPSTGTGTGTGKSAISGTFQGTTEQTQYGPMQVEIVVTAGKITDVKALQLTNQGGRSVEISNYAAPILRTEALSAQSASIQSVSGATYTSGGYISSLQSAIDKAGL